MRKLTLTMSVLIISTSIAQAHSHYKHKHHRHHAYHHYSDGRPHAWCGWWMRHRLGVASTIYNLARNWAHWGRPSEPHIGAVVVWSHHVGIITGGGPNGWIITSGNDGHAVRSRKRSIAGAIAIRA